MAQITLTVPDNIVPRVQEAFTAEFGYDPSGSLSKVEFVKQQIIGFMKDVVQRHETKANVDSSLTIT